ncbi:MAG: hypothetical protein K1X74_16710 [Pirellulales bacterium]|nr:hypothetical protein [Pirellulales bacterium]
MPQHHWQEVGGHLCDPVDPRDYDAQSSAVEAQLALLPPRRNHWRTDQPGVAEQVDLRAFLGFSDPDGGRCSAAALVVVALFQYFQRRVRQVDEAYSAAFLQSIADRYAATPEEAISLRTMFKVAAQYGLLPQRRGPDGLRNDPEEAFLYASCERPSQLVYFHPTANDLDAWVRLHGVRLFLQAGFPLVAVADLARVELRPRAELRSSPATSVLRSVVIAGYDDAGDEEGEPRGALLVTPLLGIEWGHAGYGWMPYTATLEGALQDVWTMFCPEWVGGGLMHPLTMQHDFRARPR